MPDGSKPIELAIGQAILCAIAVFVVLIIVGPALSGPADNTSSIDNQNALAGMLTELFKPSDHPLASLLALAVGVIVLIRNS